MGRRVAGEAGDILGSWRCCFVGMWVPQGGVCARTSAYGVVRRLRVQDRPDGRARRVSAPLASDPAWSRPGWRRLWRKNQSASQSMYAGLVSHGEYVLARSCGAGPRSPICVL
jgi:hypothetical protein